MTATGVPESTRLTAEKSGVCGGAGLYWTAVTTTAVSQARMMLS